MSEAEVESFETQTFETAIPEVDIEDVEFENEQEEDDQPVTKGEVLPIRIGGDQTKVVAWLRSNFDGEWLPRYDATAALMAALLTNMMRDSESVSSGDRSLLNRLLEQFGMTPLSHAKLQKAQDEG